MDRYEEALERAKAGLPMDEVFPELKESEDERIINCIQLSLTDVAEQRFTDFGTTLKDCLAYLEKQKEQKPAEWSEEDKKMIEIISNYVKNIDLLYDSFKICGIDYKAKDFKRKVLDWLKSLRPQPHWKPSKEQMEALKNSAYGTYQNGDGPALRELYNDLKKLM